MTKTTSLILFILFATFALPFSASAYSYGYDYYGGYDNRYTNSYSRPQYNYRASNSYSYTQSTGPQYSYSNNGTCLFGGLAGALTCTLGSSGGGLFGYNARGYGYSQISGPQYSYSGNDSIHQTGGLAGALMQGFY